MCTVALNFRKPGLRLEWMQIWTRTETEKASMHIKKPEALPPVSPCIVVDGLGGSGKESQREKEKGNGMDQVTGYAHEWKVRLSVRAHELG